MGQLREFVPEHSRRTAYNASGSTIATGLGVRRSGAADDQCALPSAVTDAGWAVTVESIPDLGRGGVQITGRVKAVCSAAITAGARVDCGADGKFLTHSTGTIWGVAMTTTTLADEEFELELDIAARAVS